MKNKRVHLRFVLMTVIPFLCLAVPDIVWRGWRSGVYRDMAPSYLGIQIALAYFLGKWRAKENLRINNALTAFVMVCGIVSSAMITTASSWWVKTVDYYTPELAHIINQGRSHVVIAPVSAVIFPLAHRLAPDTRILAVSGEEAVTVPAGVEEIFIYRPTSDLWGLAERISGEQPRALDPRGMLWSLRVNAPSRR